MKYSLIFLTTAVILSMIMDPILAKRDTKIHTSPDVITAAAAAVAATSTATNQASTSKFTVNSKKSIHLRSRILSLHLSQREKEQNEQLPLRNRYLHSDTIDTTTTLPTNTNNRRLEENQNQQGDIVQEEKLVDPSEQQHQEAQNDAQHQEQQKNNATNPNEEQKETNNHGSIVPLPILFIAALAAAYMIRKRMIDNSSSSSYQYHGLARGAVATASSWNKGNLGNGEDENDDDDDDAFTYGPSVNGAVNGKQNKSLGFRGSPMNGSCVQEMVPMSPSNDDEWGWENKNAKRDLEMGGSPSTKDKDDLQMALALSLNAKADKQQTNGNGATAIRKDSWDEESADWEEHDETPTPTSTMSMASLPVTSTSTAKPASTMPSPSPAITKAPDTIEDILKHNFSGSTITSFSQPMPTTSNPNTSAQKSTIIKNKKKKKVEEEDIFASMGLSSMPAPAKKQPVPAPKSAPANISSVVKQNSNGTATEKDDASKSLSAAVLAAGDDGSSLGGTADNWDNDSDLDDLLDD